MSDHELFVVIGATVRTVLQVEMEQRHREITEFEQQLRTKTELEQQFFAIVAVAAAVAVQAAVFVVENAHARRRPQEPRGLSIVSRLSLGEYHFSKQFLEPLFLSSGLNSESEMVPKLNPNDIVFRSFPKT